MPPTQDVGDDERAVPASHAVERKCISSDGADRHRIAGEIPSGDLIAREVTGGADLFESPVADGHRRFAGRRSFSACCCAGGDQEKCEDPYVRHRLRQHARLGGPFAAERPPSWSNSLAFSRMRVPHRGPAAAKKLMPLVCRRRLPYYQGTHMRRRNDA